jgi:hypothetical protein
MNYKYIIGIVLTSLCFNACIKHNYPTPPNTNDIDSGMSIYKTIAELRSIMGSNTKEIKERIVISGIVIADDKSGNLYKQVIIDDGTAAIPILLDAYNLYNDYPIGRKIYVQCKGLFTSFYYKLPLLGYAPDNKGSLAAIPFHLFGQYIRKGNTNNPITPISVSIADAKKAKPELFNRLIKISDAQIADTLTSRLYALPANISSATNIPLSDCDSNIITLRTSGYCNFQAYQPPTGRGTLTAIYSVYNNTPQLIIRDTSDVQLYRARCH